ncbi:hypothetical protein GXW74_15725 [Roseomonas eburnea]|uniref:Uncharacterized protein n=1 Tax=Neoroseomonas eburnea TaxID=1346889 RepID=A0A9X9XE08_9PROT|nr:hypothetical protein [Neoroseomonas eburnea]MBR0681944.1 hypothetical protein [Neoroseomonas eburnea]
MIGRFARLAFDAGVQAAKQPRAELDRSRTNTQGMLQDMLASHIDGEVERRLAAGGAA